MKKNWKLIMMIMAMGLIAALTACGSEPAEVVEEAVEEAAEEVEEAVEEVVSEDAGSIWVLLPDSASSARWETDDRRFFEQAFDAAGVEYNIVNAEGDAATQQTQAEQAITA